MKVLEKEKEQKTNEIFNRTEEDVLQKLHPTLLCFIVNLCLENRLSCLLKSKSFLPALMGLLQGYFAKIHNPACLRVLRAIERIVFFC